MPTQLKLTTYKPRINDPRVRRKILKVLAWCGGMRLSKKPRTVNHEEIREIFGNTDQKGLAQWLRAKLLTRSGHYVPGKQYFSYKLNLEAYEQLHEIMKVRQPSPVEIARSKFGEIIDGRAAPEYHDTGSRRYHPVQNIERELKQQVFAGWWDYDIESSAPTLIYQYAVEHYKRIMKSESQNEDLFPGVRRLTQDKASVRSHVASLTRLDGQATKELINSLFFMANTGPSPFASVFKALGKDHALHQRFMNDTFVKQLQRDVKVMWRWALLHDSYERGKQRLHGHLTNHQPTKAASRRQAIYLGLERRVMDAMLAARPASAGPYVLMHDGFMSRGQVDIAALIDAVAQKTGFTVRLSEVRLGTGESDEDAAAGTSVDVERQVESRGVLV